MLSRIKEEIGAWLRALVRVLPGRIGILIRRGVVKLACKEAGADIRIGPGEVITSLSNIILGAKFSCFGKGYMLANSGGSIEIGQGVSVNYNVMINAANNGTIKIGDNCLIGPNTVLRASNHVYSDTDVPINMQGHTAGRIELEEDVWISSNVVIAGDVHVGRGAVLAAGAVVTKDVEAFTVVGGVPAKVIRTRRKG